MSSARNILIGQFTEHLVDECGLNLAAAVTRAIELIQIAEDNGAQWECEGVPTTFGTAQSLAPDLVFNLPDRLVLGGQVNPPNEVIAHIGRSAIERYMGSVGSPEEERCILTGGSALRAAGLWHLKAVGS